MLEHCLPGAHDVTAAQRGQDGLPVTQPFQAVRAAGDVVGKLLPQRTAVHVMPDTLHRRQQHLILRRARQDQMEHLIVVLTIIVGGNRALLLLDNTAQIVDVCTGRHFGGKRGNIAFEELTGL